MKKDDFSYFIERFIAGELSDSEMLWFKKELDGNSKLKEEVKLRKKTDEILKIQDSLLLRNKLNIIEKSRKGKVIFNMPQKQLYIGIAASLTILVLFGGSLFFGAQNLSPDEIIKNYYEEYIPISPSRSAGSEVNEYLTRGLDYYQNHDHENAALFFSRVIENESKNMYATLLCGISYFEDRNYSEAKKKFEKVIDDNKNLFIDQAQWYLAFCLIQTGEKEKASQLLQKIIQEKGIYAKQSKKILRKIK